MTKNDLAAKYQKLDHREHVLKRPNMYIGNIEKDVCETWVLDEQAVAMKKKNLTYIPGLYKIFDEILVNAIDHSVRLKSTKAAAEGDVNYVKNIKVTIDKATGYIEVWNDGDGIEIERHPENNIYIPEMIFGHLLTSANYDDKDEKIIGGQNGIGAKCLSFDTTIPLYNGTTKMAKDVLAGDVLIGDDGNPRTVLSTQYGFGKMYEVRQALGATYKVNSEHTLTLHMPDHKVIFWDNNGWKMLWFDKEHQCIRSKFVTATNSDGDRNDAYIQMQEYAKTIDDDNIIDIPIKDYMQLSMTTQGSLAGVRARCVNWEDTQVNMSKTTGCIQINDIPDDDYIGIKIDGNERFCINDFTVTHNCTNVFSKHFVLETVDARRRKVYKQEFSDNMSIKSVPEIKSCSKKPYTCIRFLPDFSKFKCTSLSDDMYDLMVKRTYDACAVTYNDVSVHLNGKKLEYKTFEKYVDLYLGPKGEQVRVYERIDDRWEVVAAFNENGCFDQVSFVNGIWTIRGGKHVEYITNQLVKKLIEQAQKKKKDVSIKPQHIRDNLIVFVKSTIVNPNFDSQTKETLTTPFAKFGSKPELSDKFIDKMYKSGIVDKAITIGNLLDNKNMKKTDGKKRNVIRGLTKLEDANWAGTGKSTECTLILTEGDSAKTMAMSGIDEVGRDKYGVFPLKGKLLNVKDCAVKKICENEEISNLKKIIGLESDKDYKDITNLRYGRIMVMTDSDHDGSHIKGLLFNLFQTLWPSLFKTHGFITSMLTPVIKAKKGNRVLEFYNVVDYDKWKDQHANETGWHVKYYKGLGTSDADEARDYFRNLKIVEYAYKSENADSSIDLAFNKKRADDRKNWLSQYDKNSILDYKHAATIDFKEFVDKELIHFSNYDVQRSIPSLCDGLKISQRKILYCCFKKDWTKECRVAQLAAYVSENSAYHHGEESLNNAIISMAQNFVGANNINLLKPNGQFGSRIKGGKDSSSPRYIHTELCTITSKLFRKEDMPVLSYLDDDGVQIEPEYYVPIIPVVLVNGAVGIGTGFSTNIPSYNPKEIVRYIRRMLKGEAAQLEGMLPWFMGFKGSFVNTNGKVFSKGVFEKVSATKIRIKELPVGVWTEDFKEMLESMLDTKPYLKNYESYYSDVRVDFVLHFTSAAALDDMLSQDEETGFTKLDNEFKLVSSKGMTTTNMYLFNANGQIHKYDKVEDIIKEFASVRLECYRKRKEYMVSKLEFDIKYMQARIRFINEVIAGTLNIYNQTKKAIEDQLTAKEYPMKDGSYDYLVGMPIYNLTAEKKFLLESDLKESLKTLAQVQSNSCESMWLDELQQFEKAYDKFLLDYDTSLNKKLVSKK